MKCLSMIFIALFGSPSLEESCTGTSLKLAAHESKYQLSDDDVFVYPLSSLQITQFVGEYEQFTYVIRKVLNPGDSQTMRET